jgi:hypothetical protein
MRHISTTDIHLRNLAQVAMQKAECTLVDPCATYASCLGVYALARHTRGQGRMCQRSTASQLPTLFATACTTSGTQCHNSQPEPILQRSGCPTVLMPQHTAPSTTQPGTMRAQHVHKKRHVRHYRSLQPRIIYNLTCTTGGDGHTQTLATRNSSHDDGAKHAMLPTATAAHAP